MNIYYKYVGHPALQGIGIIQKRKMNICFTIILWRKFAEFGG